jgi:hypothetical protein
MSDLRRNSSDETRAAQFIEAVRTIDYEDGECPQMSIILDWSHDHGQSLDWLFLCDPGVMICRAARAGSQIIKFQRGRLKAVGSPGVISPKHTSQRHVAKRRA